MRDFPPTVIVVHPKEKRQKCTVEPLRGRPGFVFRDHPPVGKKGLAPVESEQREERRSQEGACPLSSTESLDGYVRLGFGGPLLGPDDAGRGLLVLDGTWRLVREMEENYRHVPVRSLPPCRTAYPRVSKMHEDPLGGLATIEAIYVAYRLLGRDTAGLLDDYRWADEFVRRNSWLFTMKEHEFTLILTADPDEDEADRIYGVIADGTLSTMAGVPQIHFHREARSLEEALRSAIADVRSAGFDVAQVEMDPAAVTHTT